MGILPLFHTGHRKEASDPSTPSWQLEKQCPKTSPSTPTPALWEVTFMPLPWLQTTRRPDPVFPEPPLSAKSDGTLCPWGPRFQSRGSCQASPPWRLTLLSGLFREGLLPTHRPHRPGHFIRSVAETFNRQGGPPAWGRQLSSTQRATPDPASRSRGRVTFWPLPAMEDAACKDPPGHQLPLDPPTYTREHPSAPLAAFIPDPFPLCSPVPLAWKGN